MLQKLETLPQGSPASPRRDNEAFAARLAKIMTDRSFKAKAPLPICPTGTLDLKTAYRQFLQADRSMEDALHNTPGLREYTFPHPVLGELDGYDWILVFALHNLRHLEQIREVKECLNFPKQ